MTNILASIVLTLVTNTSERFPHHAVPTECPDYVPGSMVHCAVFHCRMENDANPKVKWVRTTITEHTNLVFTFNGNELSQPLGERTVSDIEVECSLKPPAPPEWVPSKTNDVGAHYVMRDNYFVTVTNLELHGLVFTNR